MASPQGGSVTTATRCLRCHHNGAFHVASVDFVPAAVGESAGGRATNFGPCRAANCECQSMHAEHRLVAVGSRRACRYCDHVEDASAKRLSESASEAR